ncbi:hypothetical protein PWT90_08224 [Aphanocladium album]|nr:hypothetical protein PWT90_08224 [Aphanocladium album]
MLPGQDSPAAWTQRALRSRSTGNCTRTNRIGLQLASLLVPNRGGLIALDSSHGDGRYDATQYARQSEGSGPPPSRSTHPWLLSARRGGVADDAPPVADSAVLMGGAVSIGLLRVSSTSCFLVALPPLLYCPPLQRRRPSSD